MTDLRTLGTVELTAYQGQDETFAFVFEDENGDPIPLGNSTWKAQIRSAPDSETVLADFGVDATGAAAGTIKLKLAASDSAALPEFALWDLRETTSTGGFRFPIGGAIRTYRRITR